MHPQFKGYDTIIFDCDGVILDSNNLKIDAMQSALHLANVSDKEAKHCCDYFKANFGKSRFYHIQYFIDHFISNSHDKLYEEILDYYSRQCEELYITAKITPRFFNAIEDCPAHLYVASGSAQDELIKVFKKRNLDQYFNLILGSPKKKHENVASILKQSKGNALMVGDALSDYQAAEKNNIDFLGYLPFSNVKAELLYLSENKKFPILESW